jgi:hypothetical protein
MQLLEQSRLRLRSLHVELEAERQARGVAERNQSTLQSTVDALRAERNTLQVLGHRF